MHSEIIFSKRINFGSCGPRGLKKDAICRYNKKTTQILMACILGDTKKFIMKITKIAKFVNHEHLEHEGDSLYLKNSHNYFERNKN